jgi:hypothetical protein
MCSRRAAHNCGLDGSNTDACSLPGGMLTDVNGNPVPEL